MKLNRIFLFLSEPPASPPSNPTLLETILLQLKKWLSAIRNLFLSLQDKLNGAFPPSTRAKWLETAKPYQIGGAVFLSLLLFLYCCLPLILVILSCIFSAIWSILSCIFSAIWSILPCIFSAIWSILPCIFSAIWSIPSCIFRAIWSICRALCCCCCRGTRTIGRVSGKMMKAPGTGGQYRLGRLGFESNPGGYFRSLRADTLSVTHRLS